MVRYHLRALTIALLVTLTSPALASAQVDPTAPPGQGPLPVEPRDAGDDDADRDTGDAGGPLETFDTGQPYAPGGDAGAEGDAGVHRPMSDGGLTLTPDLGPDEPDAPDARVAGCQSEGAQGSPWAISVVLLGFMVLHAAGLLGRRHVR